jgi:hypothetical protein
MLVSVPGADEAQTMIADGVEALHARKIEFVDEADLSTIVNGKVTGKQFWLFHCFS